MVCGMSRFAVLAHTVRVFMRSIIAAPARSSGSSRILADTAQAR